MSVDIANTIAKNTIGSRPYGEWVVDKLSYDRTRDEISISVVNKDDYDEYIFKCTNITADDVDRRLSERLRIREKNAELHVSMDGIIGTEIAEGWIVTNIKWPGVNDNYYIMLSNKDKNHECKFGLKMQDPKEVIEVLSKVLQDRLAAENADKTSEDLDRSRVVGILSEIEDPVLRKKIINIIDPRFDVSSEDVPSQPVRR